MINKKVMALFGISILCAAMLPLVHSGAVDTFTITVTPTGTYDVTVNQTTYAVGDKAYDSGWTNTSATWGSVNNTGDITADINAKASDTAAWTLAATAGNQQFVVRLTKQGDSALTLTVDYLDWVEDLVSPSTGGLDQFAFMTSFKMPTSGALSGEQTSTVSITAVVPD